MAYAFVVEAPGTTAEQYDELMAALGISDGETLPGHLVHVAGMGDGGWTVLNVFDSRETADQARARVRAARARLGLGESRLLAAFPVHRLTR